MNKTFTITTDHTTETKQFAYHLAQVLQPGDVLALEGDLGAGKTTFAQGFAAGLGIGEQIDSPTFTIIKEYHLSDTPFYHMDVYRINATDEQLGLEEYFDGEGICLVEWASRIEEWLPDETIRIVLTVLADGKREIQVTTSLSRVMKWCEDRMR